ncbi:MAG: hypothetical protein WC325_12385, partial [Candidatus Bathyarchaeia archaeon]
WAVLALKMYHETAELIKAYHTGDMQLTKERLKGFANLDVLKARTEKLSKDIEIKETNLNETMMELNRQIEKAELVKKAPKPPPEEKPPQPPQPKQTPPEGEPQFNMGMQQ